MPDLLIEIGTEEIPASYIEPALEGIGESLRAVCAEKRLELPEPTRWATPRRMMLHFEGVPDAAPSVTETRRGPPAERGFDAAGEPTKAARGFARSQGVAVSDLSVVDTEKGRYLAAEVGLVGAPAPAILADALPRALRKAPLPKTMRWPGSDIAFARPIRNLVVLLGNEVVPLQVAGIRAGRATAGHRFLSPGRFDLESADLEAYREALRRRKVMVDAGERRAVILEEIEGRIGAERAEEVHGGLLREVVHLTEWPRVIEGRIEPSFLDLPVEVLEVSMRAHLRFFPVFGDDGRPEPRFLSVMDRGRSSADLVREGNERVLASRLADASFFLAEDRKLGLSDRLPELADKAVHRDLGSYREKADRLATLGAWLAQATGRDEVAEMARRAGLLAKTDLVTEMVGEFPELQGVVGRVYALLEGEDAEVAEAIEDHYRPRGPGDSLPRGPVACMVSLAEKLDDLGAFISASGAPSGSSDPFGLRRQCLGLIRICRDRAVAFRLGEALDQVLLLLGTSDPAAAKREILEFIRDRLYQHCLDEGFRYDLIRAALAAGFEDVVDFFTRLGALTSTAREEWWDDLVAVVERTANILRGSEARGEVEEAALRAPEERRLWEVLLEAEPRIGGLLDGKEYVRAADEFVKAFAHPVHDFFEKVYVNVEDPQLKANRLALLGRVNRLFAERVGDLSNVEGSEGTGVA